MIFNVSLLEKMRIDKYLSMNSEYSRSLIKKMLEQKLILLNKNEARANSMVKNGDVIEVIKEDILHDELVANDIPLDIVFENENIILINKQAGLVVHPGSGNKDNTLVNALIFKEKKLSDNAIRPGIVHRIDKDTTGLLLIAKNNKAHEILADDFKEKRITRKYLALVVGVLKHNHITIDAPIGRDTKARKKMMVTDKNSKHAITHVNVLKRFAKYTLVECVLETGRTHQIRVHMKYIGYPLFNDPVYGTRIMEEYGQFLHSSEIFFKEPLTKEDFHFKAPIPKYFEDFLKTLE